MLALVFAVCLGGTLQSTPPGRPGNGVVKGLIARLDDPGRADHAVTALVALGEEAVTPLLGEALEGNNLSRRGWAIVCLAEIGGPNVDRRLIAIHEDPLQSPLVRTWALAARVRIAKSTDELVDLAKIVPTFPALGRTIGKRLLPIVGDGKSASIEQLIGLGSQVPNLSQILAAPILVKGPEALAQAMATGEEPGDATTGGRISGNPGCAGKERRRVHDHRALPVRSRETSDSMAWRSALRTHDCLEKEGSA